MECKTQKNQTSRCLSSMCMQRSSCEARKNGHSQEREDCALTSLFIGDLEQATQSGARRNLNASSLRSGGYERTNGDSRIIQVREIGSYSGLKPAAVSLVIKRVREEIGQNKRFCSKVKLVKNQLINKLKT